MKKRLGYTVVLAILIVTLGFGFSPAQAATQPGLPADEAAYVPGQLIVGFAPSVSLGPTATRAAGLAQTVGARVLRTSDQGMTLLGVDPGTNLRALAFKLKRTAGVRFAEPNYIYHAVAPAAETVVTPPKDYIIREMPGPDPSNPMQVAYPVAGLQAMKSKVGSMLVATYPNDPLLWWNDGWRKVGADIVWNNTTPSKNVCLLSTGVDYKHPDLAASVIKGYDFVNLDSDPMDDGGLGTHLAGIIAAVRNNKQGIAGVSTGKIVAVKVLDVNEVGTVYDIDLGIEYCAARPDVSILDISLAGPDATSLRTAVNDAVTKGKLVVAPAGDNGNNTIRYPAGYSAGFGFSDEVAAVAATGKQSGNAYSYDCWWTFSNYGGSITFVAPGANIYSTTPWDKTFWLHGWYSLKERYDYMSGTEQAAAFVAGTAARAWGYQPGLNATQVIMRLKDTGSTLSGGSSCWPTGMSGVKQVNVASALDRGAVTLSVRDALSDMAIVGATVSAYSGSTLKGSSVITASFPIDSTTGMPDMVYTDWADVLNLPAVYTNETAYTPKVSATNYTASPQAAFVGNNYWFSGDGRVWLIAGYFAVGGYAIVPPKSANFSVFGETGNNHSPKLAIWLPDPNPPINSPNSIRYIVSDRYYVQALGPVDTQPAGSLNGPPYARNMNWETDYDATVIRSRASDTAAPWYEGYYQVGITDQMSDGNTNYFDLDNVSALVWKDGVVKYRANKGVTCGINSHWWFPLRIISPHSGAATYVVPLIPQAACGSFANGGYTGP